MRGDAKIITFPDRWKAERQHKIDWSRVTRRKRINGTLVDVDIGIEVDEDGNPSPKALMEGQEE